SEIFRTRPHCAQGRRGGQWVCPVASTGDAALLRIRRWPVHARSSTIAAQPSSIDRGIACLRNEVMPNISEIDGCVGLSLMVERSTGRCIATSAWESEDALHASETRVQPLRDNLVQALNGRTQKVEEWDVAVMHRDHLAGDRACTRCIWLQADPAGIER